MDLFASLFFGPGKTPVFFLPGIQEGLDNSLGNVRADRIVDCHSCRFSVITGKKFATEKHQLMKLKAHDLEKVLHDFLTLKKIRRTGWQLRGIRNGESLADHCFGVTLLTWMLAGSLSIAINRDKAVSIAIVHELGECRVGDIPYTALKYFPDKSKIEFEAIEDTLGPLGARATSETLELFKEFEDGSSVEARFVKAIDKLDMLITAAEYEKTGFAGLSDFWHNNSTFKPIEEFPELANYAEHLRSNRERRLAGRHD